MKKLTPISRELLYAYFAGTTTALQKQMIESWVEHPENEEFFYACLNEWEKENLQYVADVQSGINNFNDRVTKAPQVTFSSEATKAVNKSNIRIQRAKRWLLVASISILLGFFGWMVQDILLYKTYKTGYGETSFISLADGSKVALNANTSLMVPRFGFENNRKVKLKGEANFSVVHTASHSRFIVETDALFNIEVLGTEFTVFARPRQTKVVLTKGKVKVKYKQKEEIITPLTMLPGDVVTVNKLKNSLEKTKVLHPENHAAWKENKFVFDGTTLGEICELLKENYGLEVELKGAGLAQQKISGSFQANSVNELLQALSEIFDVNIIRENKHVVLIDN